MVVLEPPTWSVTSGHPGLVERVHLVAAMTDAMHVRPGKCSCLAGCKRIVERRIEKEIVQLRIQQFPFFGIWLRRRGDNQLRVLRVEIAAVVATVVGC